jgi:hemin uptake protein HemP
MNLPDITTRPATAPGSAAAAQAQRVNSQELLKQAKCVEIEHEGKIYELRVTRLNKLILTA